LGDDRNGRIGEQVANGEGDPGSHFASVGTEMVQELIQHLISCDQRERAKELTNFDRPLVPMVLAVGQSDPVDGIGEDPSHALGRLGVP